MAKYIGTYANSGDVQTALNNLELSRPFIAYTTDNEDVIFGSAADRAEAGDIVVYSVADDLLHYIKQTDYNTTSYPTAAYVPVGVVCYPQEDNIFSGTNNNVKFMGLNWLDKVNPDNGTPGNAYGTTIEWGDSTVDITGLTNYSNATTAIADMDGKANTEAVLEYATGQTNWKTDSAITFTNGERMFPLFECAWRYHTSGTVQGDWFVPSFGELNYLNDSTILANFNAGMALLGRVSFDFSNRARGTSTEKNTSEAFYGHTSSWAPYNKTNAEYFTARPFCSKLMTRI